MDKHEAEFQRFLKKLDFEQGSWDDDAEQDIERLKKAAQTQANQASPLRGREANKLRRKLNGGP